jgi:hypothetical protein
VNDVLVNQFNRKHANSKFIFRFIFSKAPQHHSKGVRLFSLKAINLTTKKTIDIADAYTFNNVERVMEMAVAHIKNLTCGKPAREKVYVIDDKEIAAKCKNYRNSLIALMTHPTLHDLFYVLKEEPNAGKEKNIAAVFFPPSSSTIRFEYRKYDDYVEVEPQPSVINCDAPEEYLIKVNTYCTNVCAFCRR